MIHVNICYHFKPVPVAWLIRQTHELREQTGTFISYSRRGLASSGSRPGVSPGLFPSSTPIVSHKRERYRLCMSSDILIFTILFELLLLSCWAFQHCLT